MGSLALLSDLLYDLVFGEKIFMPILMPFEEIEAIILTSACQFVLICNLNRNSVLTCLSKVLRNLALNKSTDIDESYRSKNGKTSTAFWKTVSCHLFLNPLRLCTITTS